MSKRKKGNPSLEGEEERGNNSDDNDSYDKYRLEPQENYDYCKKTIEVYPERLRELNRQFLASVSSQITTEPYSVLVGSCLDYVRQYFNYEDDLLEYSPWLATRLKQSRSDTVKCLQETIDVYEALAHHDFDLILDKYNTETSSIPSQSSDSLISNNSVQVTTSSFEFRNPTTSATTNLSLSSSSSSKSSTIMTTTTTTATSNLMSSSSFNFKMPTTTASSEKTINTSPFTFSLPNTGFGTSTFSTSILTPSTNMEKSLTGSASSISFTPPMFSFAPTPSSTTKAQVTTEDNDDEPSEPPEPEKVEHEKDAKFSYRCRMGVNKGDKFIKRGPVQVILKEVDEKRQLIVRSDDALGRLFLNILWSKLIDIKKNSTKDLTFVCKLNPAMPEISEGEFVRILFRFDNEVGRNDAYENLEKEQT